MKVYFYLSKKRLNAKGVCPITCRVTSSQHIREDFRTKIYIEPARWDSIRCTPLDNDQFIATRLANISNKVYQLIATNPDTTPREIVALYKSSSIIKPTVLSEIVEEMFQKKMFTADVKFRRASGIKEFIAFTKNVSLCKVQQWHIEGFYSHLIKTQSGYTVEKKVSHIKRLFTYAKENEYIQVSPFVNYKSPQLPKIELIQVTSDEIDEIVKSEYKLPRLNYIRDLFLFQCYTGLAYVDVFHFNKDKVITKAGKDYLSGKRGKNGAEYFLPFLPEAMVIAEKYNYTFPKLSNEKYNERLKEVASVAKINKNLTTHVGRKTFGQLMIDRGYSAESVSKMLGHASFDMTQRHYARISEKRIENEHQLIKAA